MKASDVFLAVAAYQQLAEAVDCPLHLGITEAGGLIGGTVKSSIGIGILLWAGIGDTIRVSLSAEPEEEVRVGYRDPEVARPPQPRRPGRLLPELRAPGLRRHPHRPGARGAAAAHQDADVARRCSAASSTAPAKRAKPTSASPAAATASTWSILSGVTDHHVQDADMIDHIVKLVEAKAAEIEAGISQTRDAA